MQKPTRRSNTTSKSSPRTISCERCWPAQRGGTRSRKVNLMFRGSERLFPDDAFALLDGDELPGGNLGIILGLAIKPADRKIGRNRFAKAEVQAKIVLRDIGTAAAYFVDLLLPSRSYGDAGP